VWDDGKVETAAAAGGQCKGSHRFEHAGMYTIQTTVTDDDGGSGSATALVIVHDPRAGDSDGSGLMESPPGALPAEPTVSCLADFDFEVKYEKGHDHHGPARPSGWLKFKVLHHFELRATSFEWLVVTRDRKTAIKGVGKRAGGKGKYGFILFGVDLDGHRRTRDPDLLRVVAWPLEQGPIPTAPLAYDNRPGQSYDLDQANPQPIESGCINVNLRH
jgi:hypothetical protein